MMFTPQEAKGLSTLLDRAVNPDNALTLEGLHGFLYGLAIIPDPIIPNDWLPGVFGEEMMKFKTKAEADKLMGCLFAVYNRINADDKLEFPFDMEHLKEGDAKRMQEWAYGLFLVSEFDKHEYQKAIYSFSKALEKNPKTYLYRGLSYDMIKQHKKAIENYNMAIEQDPKMSEAYNNRGLAYANLYITNRLMRTIIKQLR